MLTITQYFVSRLFLDALLQSIYILANILVSNSFSLSRRFNCCTLLPDPGGRPEGTAVERFIFYQHYKNTISEKYMSPVTMNGYTLHKALSFECLLDLSSHQTSYILSSAKDVGKMVGDLYRSRKYLTPSAIITRVLLNQKWSIAGNVQSFYFQWLSYLRLGHAILTPRN